MTDIGEPAPDIAKVRELIELVTAKAGHPVPPEHVAIVLMVLDSHHLVRDFPGTAAEYHARVQRAYSVALRKVMGDE